MPRHSLRNALPHLHRALTLLLAIQMAVQPMLAAAAGASEAALLAGGGDHAPSDIVRPYVDAARDTVPVVNINTPNGAGLSHNTYEHFNVGPQGLVLNNNATNVLSQQAGWVEGNPNLRPGNEASLILNEVVGASRSQLNGYLEVAGKKADVVVANPNGITCKGCGFINTDRATLTTGKPEVADNGRGGLTGFAVQQGGIAFEGNGLDARQQGQVDVLARAVKVNAQIQAQHLKVVAGANRISRGGASDGQAAPIAGAGAAPSVAVDSTALGGMYANRIQLTATEAGVGVNLGGETRAASDLSLDVNGNLNLDGNTQGETAITARANSLNVRGTVQSAGDVTLTARDSATTHAGSKLKGNNLNLTTTAGNLTHQGDAQANADLTLSASNTLSHTGTTHSTGTTRLKGKQVAISGGKSTAQGNLEVGGSGSTGIAASHADSITLTDATLQSQGGDLSLKATGTTHLTRSKASASGNTLSQAGSHSLTDSELSAQGNTQVEGADGGKASAITATGSALVAATGDLGLKAGNLAFSNGQCVAGNGLSIQADTLSNTRNLLWALNNLTVDNDGAGGRATSISNTESDMVAYLGDLSLSATTLTNQGKAPTYIADGYAATWYETASGSPDDILPNTWKLLDASALGADGKPKPENAAAYTSLLASLMAGSNPDSAAKALLKASVLNPDGSLVAGLVGTWSLMSGRASQQGITDFDAHLKQLLLAKATDGNGDEVDVIQADGSIHPDFADEYAALWEAAISGSAIPANVLALLKPEVQSGGAVITSISSQWDSIRTVAGAGYEIKKTLIADVLNHDGVLAQLSAGNNILIDSDSFNNLHANVSAGADIAITAASTLNNVAYGASQTLHEVHKTGCFTCHSGILGYRETFGGLIEAKNNITLVTGNYSSTVEATRNTLFNLPPVNEFHDLRAASNPTPRDFKVLLDVQAPEYSDALRTGMVDVNGQPLSLAGLTGPYNPFSLPAQVGLPYASALETRFPYTDYGTFLSSAYMSARLKYSPEHEPRMNSDEWAGLRLLANAAANLRATDTIGQGQAANTRKGSTQLSARNIAVYASGNITLQGGNTQASQNLTLSADGNLEAKAAALGAGNNLVAVAGNNLTLTTSSTASGGNTTLAAGNDLKLASATQTDSGTRGDVKWTNSREVGNSISSGGNLTLVAGNDIGVRASTATAEGQLTASAGNDLNVEAGENYQSHEYHRSETKKSWGGLKKKTTTTDHFEEHLTHTASTLQGKGGVSLEAGNDTTLVGSKLQSGGNLDISTGGQLAILAAEDKHVVQHDQKTKKSFAGINYGKSTRSTRSTQTRVAGSASEAMGDMATTSGGSSTFQASSLQAGGTLNVKAGGGVNIVSGTNTSSLNSQASSSAFGGALSSNSTDTVQQSTVAGSTLNAKHISIDANNIVVEASQIEAQTVSLIADTVALVSGKNSLYENHTSDDSGILLREIETQGQIKQEAVAATLTAGEITLNGKQLVDASLSTEALLQRVSSEGKLTDAQLTTLKAQLENQSWHEKQTTLSKMGGLIVQAVAAYLAPGVGSSFGQSLGQIGQVMVQRAVNQLSQQVTQALLTAAVTGNKVELDFDELLKSAVKTGVLAGINAKLDQQFGFSKLDANGNLQPQTLTLDQQLVQASLHAATQTTLQGGNFADNLSNGLVDKVGENLAGWIGDNKTEWGEFGHKAAHAALGCAIVAAKQGDCSAGAIGAVAGEVAAELTRLQAGNLSENQQDRVALLTGQLSAITAAALAGQEDLAGAMGAASNAVVNNYLKHGELDELYKKFQACETAAIPVRCRAEAWAEAAAQSEKNLQELQACGDDPACIGKHLEAYAAGEALRAKIAMGDWDMTGAVNPNSTAAMTMNLMAIEAASIQEFDKHPEYREIVDAIRTLQTLRKVGICLNSELCEGHMPPKALAAIKGVRDSNRLSEETSDGLGSPVGSSRKTNSPVIVRDTTIQLSSEVRLNDGRILPVGTVVTTNGNAMKATLPDGSVIKGNADKLVAPQQLLTYSPITNQSASDMVGNVTAPIDFDGHILGAEINKSGTKATGGHSTASGKVDVVNKGVSDKYGVYEATIQIPNPKKPGQYLTKNSTMFPDGWSADRVKVEVDEAFKNKTLTTNSQGQPMWEGLTPSGVVVKGYLNPKVTVYPVKNKE